MKDITEEDFGLPENENNGFPTHIELPINERNDAIFRDYQNPIISYSIDRPGSYIYELGSRERYYIPQQTEYSIEYYCPDCGARYSFKGVLRAAAARQTSCIACGNTIQLPF